MSRRAWTYPLDQLWDDTPWLFWGSDECGRCTIVARIPRRWLVVAAPRWLHHCIPAENTHDMCDCAEARR